MRIAVLGTGIMGAPIARNLAAAGHEVVAWNRTREKAEGLGAEVADTPAEAAEGADTVLTMLSDGPAVEAVIPDLKPEQLWIQMSTVGIADTERFAARHERYVDSPVLGSLPQAESAELLALGAGRERPDEVYEAISNNVLWLGDEPGAGTRLKLTINLWIINLIENLVECWVMAEALGLDPTKFLEAIKGRAMDSTYAHLKGQKIIDDEYSAVFSVRNAAKDVRLAIEAAKSAGVDLGLAPVTLERFERAIELGHGDDDTAAAWFASRPA